jgi:CubicO group peptidase (beta-lactamase class C family)
VFDTRLTPVPPDPRAALSKLALFAAACCLIACTARSRLEAPPAAEPVRVTDVGGDDQETDVVAGDLGARLDAELTRFAEYGFWGTVLVVRDGRVALARGYGYADGMRGIPNTAATRFEMNSMTKMFTGAAILKLAAQGRVQLGDPIERYLGAFPANKRDARVEHLAGHTAGLFEKGADLDGATRDVFIAAVKRAPRESPAGERYRYSNAGFSVLAAVIEVVSGERYEAYLRSHLFVPAGMRTAIFRDEVPPLDHRFARGHVGTPASLEPGPPNPYDWGTRGAGGVWCTVRDIDRWLVAVEGSAILPAEQRRILFAEPRPPAEEMYGWRVEQDDERRLRIRKGGGSDDFASNVTYYPRERATIVWASNNLRQRWRKTLDRALPAIVFGGTGASLPPVARWSPDRLRAASGRYSADTQTLELRVGSAYLYSAANELRELMFFPVDDTHLVAYDPPTATTTRLSLDDARTISLELPSGQRIVFTRTSSESTP